MTMNTFREISRSFKEKFNSPMNENDQPAYTASNHRPDKSASDLESASELEHDSVRNTFAERKFGSIDGKDDKQNSHRQSHNENELSQSNRGYLTEITETVNDDMYHQRIEQKKQHQAQKHRCDKLNLELGKIQVENAQLKQQKDEMKAENDQQQLVSTCYAYIVQNFLQPYAREKGLQYSDRNRDTIRFIMEPLLDDANHAVALQRQVDDLQQQLIERAGKTNATSDEHLAQEFLGLAAHIKTLSRLIEPYEGVDVIDTLGLGGLAGGTSKHHWSGRPGKRRFIEAWTWSLLMTTVFPNPFDIFGVSGEGADHLWVTMFGQQHHQGWPVPTSPSENWRQTTIEHMAAWVDEDIFTSGKKDSEYQWLEANMMQARANIAEIIESGLTLISPRVDSLRVLQVIDKAFDLAKHMGLQRSRVQITAPRIGDVFSNLEMSPVLDDEDDEDQYGLVASVINPGLTKWGDSHGKNFEHRYNIVRALVQPEPQIDVSHGISLN